MSLTIGRKTYSIVLKLQKFRNKSNKIKTKTKINHNKQIYNRNIKTSPNNRNSRNNKSKRIQQLRIMRRQIEVNINHQFYLSKLSKSHKRKNKSLMIMMTNNPIKKRIKIFYRNLELLFITMMRKKIKSDMSNKISIEINWFLKGMFILKINQYLCFYMYLLKKKSLWKRTSRNIVVSILKLFIGFIIFFLFVVNNLVKLHEGFNEFLPNLLLYFPRRIFNPEFINLILP